MPRVTLAYRWEGPDGPVDPDRTVDVDDATASDLFDRGWARPADEPQKGGK